MCFVDLFQPVKVGPSYNFRHFTFPTFTEMDFRAEERNNRPGKFLHPWHLSRYTSSGKTDKLPGKSAMLMYVHG